MEDGYVWDRKDMNIIERLICEVQKRPLLWDKRNDDYKNRFAMDVEWENIAVLLNRDKEFLKQKWRNLRDQFQRETKKVKVPFDNPTKPYLHYYRGKWIYFEKMIFLKNSPGQNSSCSQDEIDLMEDDIKREIVVFDDDILAEHVSNASGSNQRLEPIISTNGEIVQPKLEIIEDEFEVYEEDIGRKRKASECMSESSAKSKKMVADVAETACQTEHWNESDADLHFLKSLLPYFKKMAPLKKLFVRNEIQSLLIKESLCDKCQHGWKCSNSNV